jgi:hypothetical protein
MSHRARMFLGGAALAVLCVTGTLAIAQTPQTDHRHKETATSAVDATDAGKHQPGMHMHKSDVIHKGSDAEVAAEFKGEASELRALAASHRKLAELYKT